MEGEKARISCIFLRLNGKWWCKENYLRNYLLKLELTLHFVMHKISNFYRYGSTTVIRYVRPEFKFPDKIEMSFSQMLAIRS